MIELTRSKALRLTRKGWRELAKSGEYIKPDWMYEYISSCPLCEYTTQLTKSDRIGSYHGIDDCVLHCPMVWPANSDGRAICFYSRGLWYQWRNESSKVKRKKLAKQISELPRKRIATTK